MEVLARAPFPPAPRALAPPRAPPEQPGQADKWPAAGEQPPAPAVPTRTTAARRDELQRYVADDRKGDPPTLKVMTAHLASKGFPVSIAAVHADYRKFGLHSRHPGGRPPRLPLA